jgi:hypothetical protein
MIKRILVLGIAVAAMATVAPAIGLGGLSISGDVAQAQDEPDPAAPDQTDPSDTAPEDNSGGDSGGDAEDGPCPGEARASGDSCPPPAQQPEQPAPEQKPQEHSEKKHEASGTGGESAGSPETQPTTQVVQATPVAAQGVDTGTVPTGGIQAGAGGTSADDSEAGLVGGTALVLVALLGGGFALRRRHDLAS